MRKTSRRPGREQIKAQQRKKTATKARMVQKIERLLSIRFTIVKIENTTKAFSMLNWIIRRMLLAPQNDTKSSKCNATLL